MATPDRPCLHQCNRSTCSPTACHGRIPWDELPCREFCNHYLTGYCSKDRCGNPYPNSDPRHWLGRGSEPVPGKPFGWAHNMERDAIRRHLRRRIWKFGLDGKAGLRLEARVSQVQHRLQRDYHRRKPPIGVRRTIPAKPPVEDFTIEELEMIAERFAGANDDVGQSITAKARRKIDG